MTARVNGHLAQSRWTPPSPAVVHSKLRAVILLAGSVRPNDLSLAVDRSLLDLPVDAERTVLSLWQAQVESLARMLNRDRLPLRIAVDQAAPPPTIPPPVGHVALTVERDAHEFRGTGGLLRDLAVAYRPDEFLLIATAAQILFESLTDLAVGLFGSGGNVSFIGHRDGTPCGLFLIRCDALSSIRDVGFLDFKEQVLPKLGAEGHQVRHVMHEQATAVPIRTLTGYLSGVRAYARLRDGLPRDNDPFAEAWSPTFAVVEPGATVDSAARIHDSVVLRGAVVPQGAVVVRSVLGPGAIVRPGETISDEAVGAPGGARRAEILA